MTSIFGIFGSLGQQVAQAEATVENQATQAFYAIAGELLIIIFLGVLILARVWGKR
jgi:hypothetical protein